MRKTSGAVLLGLFVATLIAPPAQAGMLDRIGRAALRGLGGGVSRSAERGAVRGARSAAARPPAKAAAARAAGAGSAGQWLDRGVHRVPVASLPRTAAGAGSPASAKASRAEIEAGLRELQRMRPVIESGRGASSAYWREADRRAGRTYANGRQRIYDAYYGSRGIRVEKSGDAYVVTNGHHRVEAARELGIDSLPMRVVESVRGSGVK